MARGAGGKGGAVMSRFSPEAFQVAYRPGIRGRGGKGRQKSTLVGGRQPARVSQGEDRGGEERECT